MLGPREIAQGLRAITTLDEDPGSLPSTHIRQLPSPYSDPGDLTPSDLRGHLHTYGTYKVMLAYMHKDIK